jgi:hypothetical protein
MSEKPEKMPSKRERFEGLWPNRIEKASAAIRRLGNLSTSAYDWQPNEISEGLRRLSREISDVSERFRRSRRWPKK